MPAAAPCRVREEIRSVGVGGVEAMVSGGETTGGMNFKPR